ncbi:MAG: flippase-like domain-containing protein [Pseudomonadota bacterium]
MDILNKKLFHILGLLISLVFIFFVFRGTDLANIINIISGLNLVSVATVAVLSLALVVFKTLRWKLLLNKSEHIHYAKLLKINFAAHMFNIIFPFRAGEIIQIFLTKGHASTGKSNITASIVLNKFFELLSLLVIFYSLIAAVSIPIPAFWLHPIKYLLVFSIVFLLLFAFRIIDGKKIKLPKNALLKSVHSFLVSLNHISDKVLLVKAALLSMFVWGIEIFMIYILLNAFNITVPVWASVVVLVGINLAMLIPATSASFGTYEYSIILVLGIFAVTKDVAVAFAVTLHFLEIILVLSAGIFSYIKIRPALAVVILSIVLSASALCASTNSGSVKLNTIIVEDFKDNTPGTAPREWSRGNNEDGKIDYYIVKEKNKLFFRGDYIPGTTGKIIHIKKRCDIKNTPYLSWKWRAREFPKLDSIEKFEEPDNVATVYVLFKKRLIIKYDWSQFNCKKTPDGEPFFFESNSSSRMIIKPLRCTTKRKLKCCKDKANVWRTEKVNLIEDFKKFFKRDWTPEYIEGIGILVDGDDTKTPGVSADFSDFVLSSK